MCGAPKMWAPGSHGPSAKYLSPKMRPRRQHKMFYVLQIVMQFLHSSLDQRPVARVY